MDCSPSGLLHPCTSHKNHKTVSLGGPCSWLNPPLFAHLLPQLTPIRKDVGMLVPVPAKDLKASASLADSAVHSSDAARNFPFCTVSEYSADDPPENAGRHHAQNFPGFGIFLVGVIASHRRTPHVRHQHTSAKTLNPVVNIIDPCASTVFQWTTS